MARLSPEAKVLIKTFTAVTVKHDHLMRVDDELSLLVEEHTHATHVLLCGPGGVGKSKVLAVVAQRFNDEEPDRFVVPILLLEPIPPDLGPYLRLDYYQQILTALKDHILVKEILEPVAHLMASPRTTRKSAGATDWLKMRVTAEQALIRAQVKAVFIDEGHRLMQGDGSHSVDEQLEWLKSLTNRTHVLYVIYNLERSGRLVNNLHYVYSELVSDVLFQKSRARLYIIHVLAGPYSLFGFRNTMGQLARRGRDIHFQRYHVSDKEERKQFVAALSYLLERVPLDVDLDSLLKGWRWFAENSVGSIGVLKDWLVDAAKATLAQGGTSLTEEILTRTMLHPSQRLSLEMEARTGEQKVAIHNSESAKQFQALLKKPAKAEATQAQGSGPGMPPATQTKQDAKPASTTPPLPQVSPKPTQPHVGQRAPGRDPVGEASIPSMRKAAVCSFTEAIPVTLAQMEESGVSRFECPTCLAVRDSKPKGERVKFPWHPKRTTAIPNHGKRWVRRGSIWEPTD